MMYIKKLKNKGLRTVATLVAALFLISDLSLGFAMAPQTTDSTLVPYLITQLLSEYNEEYSRAGNFARGWEEAYAKGLVSKIVSRTRELGLNIPVTSIEKEIKGQIKDGFLATGRGRVARHRRPVTESAPFVADLVPGAVLIMVHTGTDGEDHGDTNRVVRKGADVLLDSGVFDSVYEFETSLYPSYTQHRGQLIIQEEPGDSKWPNFVRDRESAHRGKTRTQGARDYSLRDLEGNVFVLAGGGFGACHLSAFKGLISEIRAGVPRSSVPVVRVVIPTDSVYVNRIYDDTIYSETISPQVDFSNYVAALEEAGIGSYRVVLAGEIEDFVLEEKGTDRPGPVVELRIETEVESLVRGIAQDPDSRNSLPQVDIDALLEVIGNEFAALRTRLARERDPKPGFLAGFGDAELGIDEFGVDLHEILNSATRETIKEAEPVRVGDLITDKSKLVRLSARETELSLYPIPGWVDRFAELYREALAEKGLTEPVREEKVREIQARIIAHPSTHSGRESIYMDELYYNMLESSENADDLFISLVRHEAYHIANPEVPEERVNELRPIDDVRAAIKRRTILVAQSGGDCAGLNTVVGGVSKELRELGWKVVGIREGFTGLASENLDDFLIPIDGPLAGRLLERPSTDLKSSREDPFKIVAEINKNKDTDPETYQIFDKIKTVDNWQELTDPEQKWIDELYRLMGPAFRKDIDKFVRTMKNIEGYGGVIVTGGDDHCKVAMNLAQLRKGKPGAYIAIPKSIDADAMVQMLGYNTAAEHIRDRFWRSAVTGRKKKVFVGEIMGRKAGWLTLAASDRRAADDERLRETVGGQKVDAVKDTVMSIIPEKTVSIRKIVLRAKEILENKGALNIAVSEGFSINPKEEKELWDEFVAKNPIIAAKVSAAPELDIHGNMRLAGASEFVCAMLVTEWEDPSLRLGLTWDDLRHTIFGYIGRGLRPNEYDYRMARRYSEKAADLINRGETGRIVAYSDNMHPFEHDPIALAVEDVLTINGKKLARNLETLGENRSGELRDWLESEGYGRGFEVYSDYELAEAGVVLEDGSAVAEYEVTDERVSLQETVLDFKDAVKLIREDFISTAVSGWVHKRGSIFEVPENTEEGLLTMAVADRQPLDHKQWDAVDAASWEKIKDTIMILLPGDGIPFSHMLREAAKIKRTHGVVNIAVASNYLFDMEDPVIRQLIEEDPYVNAKFRLTNPDHVTGTFAMKDASEFIQTALVKFHPDAFPGASHARCNQLGASYFVREPSQLEREVYEGRIMESRREGTADVTRRVESLTKDISNHMMLKPEGAIDTSDIVVLMRTDLTESIAGRAEDPLLQRQYSILKQQLRKMFNDGRGLEEFASSDEILERAEYLMARGKKVIILDDASIADPDIENLQSQTGKESGKDFVVIAGKQMSTDDQRSMFFVNINAMALMGVAVLREDQEAARLFNLAYKLFTGQAAPDGLLSRLKSRELLSITVIPRMIRLTGSIVDYNDIGRLFAVAA